jgi:glutathione S-transferase
MTPILHHYDISPFSEKIRLVFGLKRLAWRSVNIPAILPKPDYTALTGGYRRTPSLQIGADVICDTRLIVGELERRHPYPTLFPGGEEGVHRAIESWADGALFWPCALAVIGANVDALPPEFHADRAAMRGRPPPTPARIRAAGDNARAQCLTQVRWIENMLRQGSPFLRGDAPGLADLAVYHALWFLERFPRKLLHDFVHDDAIPAWMARVAALGHGTSETLSAPEALAIADTSRPAPVPPSSDPTFAPGARVTVTPEERTSPPVHGEVVSCDAERVVIRHVDSRAGAVHIHFPRVGYQVAAADGPQRSGER